MTRTGGVVVGLLTRAALLLGVLVGLSVVAFTLPQLTGVDPARAVIRARAAEAAPDQATVDRLTATLGLDRSLGVRYLHFLRDLVTGDLGRSYTTGTPVSGLVGDALGVSLTLVVAALVVAVLVGALAGVGSALRAGRAVDHALTAVSRVAAAVPEFVVAPVAVLLLAVHLRWLPATGWGSAAEAVQPVAVVAAFPAALVAQLVRGELLASLDHPWVQAARARGVPERRIVRHALRASTASIVSVTTLFVPGLLGGAVVVEVVFAIPGLGRLLYGAVTGSDLPVLQAGLMAVMLVAVGASLLGDVLRVALDPRLRRGATV